MTIDSFGTASTAHLTGSSSAPAEQHRLERVDAEPLRRIKYTLSMRRSRLICMTLLTQAAIAATARAQSSAADAVPVYREQRHHLVYENALVRVLDVRVPAGDTTGWHVHSDWMFGVVIAGARSWDQRPGRDPTVWPADTVGMVFDNGGSFPYTHRVGNIDTVSFRYIVGVVRRRTGITSPPLRDVEHLALERDTAGVRVYRVRLAPGETTTSHRHAAPGLTIQVGAGDVRAEGTPPLHVGRSSGAGAWSWRGAGHTHLLRNAGNTPVELVEIDWP